MNDWRSELGNFLTERNRRSRAEKEAARFKDFVARVVMPAFQELCNELKKYGRATEIRETDAAATLSVSMDNENEISFQVLCRSLPDTIIPCAEARYRERKGQRILKSDVLFREAGTKYVLEDVTKDEIIQGFLKAYRSTFED